jgi:hypothetical protein
MVFSAARMKEPPVMTVMILSLARFLETALLLPPPQCPQRINPEEKKKIGQASDRQGDDEIWANSLRACSTMLRQMQKS